MVYGLFVNVDDEGQPIVVGLKFRENHQNMDVSSDDMRFISERIYQKASTRERNLNQIQIFRDRKK